MKKEIQERGFDFSIRIAELVQFLRTDKLAFPLCDRLLICGVGAGLACRKAAVEERRQAVGFVAASSLRPRKPPAPKWHRCYIACWGNKNSAK